jgi:hypothetical protein
VFAIALRLLAHPACSLDARQAKNRDGINDGLRSVAVEWSLLCMSNTVIIELTNNRPRAPVYFYRNELSYSKNGDGLISTRPSVCKVPFVWELSQGQC